jgi:hypothetical protein
VSLGSGAATLTFNVGSNHPWCGWEVSWEGAIGAWAHFVGVVSQGGGDVVSGAGPGSVTWAVDANGTTTPRHGTFNIGNYLIVIDQAAAPPPDTPPGGGDPPGGDPPGSTVTYGSGDTLRPGQLLQSLASANGSFHFYYQGDGNVVLYNASGAPLWASNTAGTSVGEAAMQGDGNFVVYNQSMTPIWASNTAGNSGAYLLVQNDGNVVIYSASGGALWATNTVQNPGGPGDMCASPATHNHSGSCGSADECGHVFGSSTDCGCPDAPEVYDTCYQMVCDTGQNWVDDWCDGTDYVCSTVITCQDVCDESGFCWNECTPQDVCENVPITYICGGHWETYETNCREEAYACNPHRCQ